MRQGNRNINGLRKKLSYSKIDGTFRLYRPLRFSGGIIGSIGIFYCGVIQNNAKISNYLPLRSNVKKQ